LARQARTTAGGACALGVVNGNAQICRVGLFLHPCAGLAWHALCVGVSVSPSTGDGPGDAPLTMHASLTLYKLCLRMLSKYSSTTKIDSVATGDMSETPRH
jgi:hypothetical protein